MVQRENGLVGRKVAMGASGLALLWACAALPAIGMASRSDCPPVTSAEAWVNKMPTVGDSARRNMLIVSLKLESETAYRLAPADTDGGDALILDLASTEDGVPGVAGYREPPREPARKQVRIQCEGKVVGEITEIKAVY
ncbi:MAG: hypothetical protein AAFQ21_11470 [Pseudomonadota bacterium]